MLSRRFRGPDVGFFGNRPLSRGDVVLRHFCGRLVLGAFCWRWVLRALGGRPRSFRERVVRHRRGLGLAEGFARWRWHGLCPGRGRLLHRHGLFRIRIGLGLDRCLRARPVGSGLLLHWQRRLRVGLRSRVSRRLHTVVVAQRWCYWNGSGPNRGRLARRHCRGRALPAAWIPADSLVLIPNRWSVYP